MRAWPWIVPGLVVILLGLAVRPITFWAVIIGSGLIITGLMSQGRKTT